MSWIYFPLPKNPPFTYPLLYCKPIKPKPFKVNNLILSPSKLNTLDLSLITTNVYPKVIGKKSCGLTNFWLPNSFQISICFKNVATRRVGLAFWNLKRFWYQNYFVQKVYDGLNHFHVLRNLWSQNSLDKKFLVSNSFDCQIFLIVPKNSLINSVKIGSVSVAVQ